MSTNKANRRPSAWQTLYREDRHYAMDLLSPWDILGAFCTNHLYQSLDLLRNSDLKHMIRNNLRKTPTTTCSLYMNIHMYSHLCPSRHMLKHTHTHIKIPQTHTHKDVDT